MTEYYVIKKDDAIQPEGGIPQTPSWMSDFEFMMKGIMLMVLLGIAYELRRPRPVVQEGPPLKPQTQPIKEDLQTSALTPQEIIWSEKASKNYTQAQGKKWKKWREAMYGEEDSLTKE